MWHAYRRRHTTETTSCVWYFQFTRLNVSLTELALSDAQRGSALCKVPTTRVSLSLTRALPSFSHQLLPEHPTQKSGLDSKGRMWDLMQFVGEGGREEWMIYWLLYKSKAVVVISFQDAVMRFWPVFSPRWCDFVPDITMQLPCVCICVCECLTLYDMLLWFYQEAQLKQHLYFCVHGGDKIWAPFSLSTVTLCLPKYVHFRPFRKNI